MGRGRWRRPRCRGRPHVVSKGDFSHRACAGRTRGSPDVTRSPWFKRPGGDVGKPASLTGAPRRAQTYRERCGKCPKGLQPTHSTDQADSELDGRAQVPGSGEAGV